MQVNKNRKTNKVRIGTFIVIVFLLIYIPSFIHWVYGTNISTDFIRMGNLEDSINENGYLIRDEEVLKSPYEGNFIKEVAEGERVSANGKIATVLKESSLKILDEIKAVELEMVKILKEKSENREIFSEDIMKIDNEIGQKIKGLVPLTNSNNLSKLKETKEEINKLVQKKTEIMGGVGTSDIYLSSLKKKKEQFESMMNASKTQIVSKAAGVVSYHVDGYEAVLSPAGMKDLTPKFLEELKVKSFESGESVQAGQPVVKVIKSIESFIVVVLPPQKADILKIDDIVQVRINDIGKTVDGIVDYKSDKQEGKYIVGVRIDKGISDTSLLRKVNIDLIKSSHEGMRVPLESLIEKDFTNMKAKIVLVKGNYATIREVKIKGKNDEFAIVEKPEGSKNSVSLYDTYVLNPKNIEEGQMINK
ncbi:MAG: hypothetical protein N2645_07215 [Clostridia bacterium]|nr:hypothetical protein [Clostridia bacterium]